MKSVSYNLGDEAATVALGARIASALGGGLTIYLAGELGAGKTTLCRGILRGLGLEGAVTSPTFTQVGPYETPTLRIF
ncbi:MAG: tRNA (adenosine(37)-N6)-threonylcarbamoyltransferase complex ATPase subunit type 1 TsaE, partial [Pseudomonadales bacterium]|nr:tRNA (adenosine(37)-N6)-threonylcarbamoyltransferase complex ATPase subunit type 1 TsaE [Pseudomonadales bacterium]